MTHGMRRPLLIVGLLIPALILAVWSAIGWNRAPTEANPPLPTAQWLVGQPPLQSIVTLEVAVTPEQQQIGLSRREKIGNADGMAFPRPPSPAAFWMQNTRFPLDLVFVGPSGKILNVIDSAAPGTDRLHRSAGATSLVIEVSAGRSKLLGLVPGASVTQIHKGPQS